MNTRVNPFADLANPPVFTTKTKAEMPVPTETIERIADDHNFPSRQARRTRAAPVRKPRIYRTGRNRNFSVKASTETVERFYTMADQRTVTLGALLELALDALERETARENAVIEPPLA
jgi:hypothetical protein